MFKHNYNTPDINNMADPLNEALKEAKEVYDIEVNRCCIGAAGPVSRKRSYIKLTNYDLRIDQNEVAVPKRPP